MASRDLVVHLIGDDASLQRAYKRSAESTAKFDRQMNQTARGAVAGSGAFRSMGRSVAFASTGFLSGAGLVAGLKSSVSAASNLAEQQNKVNVVFGKSGQIVNDFAKTTATSMGIANDQALEAAGTFGNLFRTVDLAPEKNAQLSTSLVKLAADMASFNNADPSEVLLALRSGLIGEAEPLRRFGVLLSETRVQQEAMRETGKDNAKQLTDQEKVLARYNLILQDTVPAQGDFARTQDGLANSQRSLTAQIRELSSALGTELMPIVGAVTKTLADGIAARKGNADATKNISLQSRLLGVSLRGLGAVWDSSKKHLNEQIAPLQTINAELNKLSETAKKISPIKISITGVAERQPGRSPGGAAPFGPQTSLFPTRSRPSLDYQISLQQQRLAKAELTASQADDRAALVRLRGLVQRKIDATKDLKLRTQLYGDLKSINDQIQGIDDKIARDRQDAADKEKTARQKQLDAEKKRREALAERNRKAREAWQAQLATIREGTASVMAEFGQLPFLTTPAGVLGAPVQSAKGFVSAYVKQTRTGIGFNNALARLVKMGAPIGLVGELRGLGPDAGGLVRSLIGHPGQLNTLIRSYGQRKEAAMQIAKADIHARVVHIYTGGARPHATTATSRRGPRAGVALGTPANVGL